MYTFIIEENHEYKKARYFNKDSDDDERRTKMSRLQKCFVK